MGIAAPSLYAAFGDKRRLSDRARRSPGCCTPPLLAPHRVGSLAAIRARLQEGADAGELPPGTDVGGLAGLYGAAVGGMSARARDGATRQELLAIAESAMAAWPAPLP